MSLFLGPVGKIIELCLPPAPAVATGARSTVSRTHRAPPSVFRLLDLQRHRFTCTVTSDEKTRSGSEPRPPAHGVNPRVPLGESHFGPVRHEWLHRIAPKIIETLNSYHDDNVETQSGAGSWMRPNCITPNCRSAERINEKLLRKIET